MAPFCCGVNSYYCIRSRLTNTIMTYCYRCEGSHRRDGVIMSTHDWMKNIGGLSRRTRKTIVVMVYCMSKLEMSLELMDMVIGRMF